jgi:ribonuclease E
MNEPLFTDSDDEPEMVSENDHESSNESSADESETAASNAYKKRRRGSRGGRNRPRPQGATGDPENDDDFDDDDDDNDKDNDNDNGDDFDDDGDESYDEPEHVTTPIAGVQDDFELPERMSEGRADVDAATEALVPRPKIGDTRASSVPATPPLSSTPSGVTMPGGTRAGGPRPNNQRKGKGQQTAKKNPVNDGAVVDPNMAIDAEPNADETATPTTESANAKKKRRRNTKSRGGSDIRNNDRSDAAVVERRKGRERNGRPIGRYFMAVQVRDDLTQVAVMEGRSLIEHYVSRPADDVAQIHGNIYVGKVQNVLPGMEAAFVDIGTPKNAVLYRGDVQYDAEDIVDSEPRIEQILKGK